MQRLEANPIGCDSDSYIENTKRPLDLIKNNDKPFSGIEKTETKKKMPKFTSPFKLMSVPDQMLLESGSDNWRYYRRGSNTFSAPPQP